MSPLQSVIAYRGLQHLTASCKGFNYKLQYDQVAGWKHYSTRDCHMPRQLLGCIKLGLLLCQSWGQHWLE